MSTGCLREQNVLLNNVIFRFPELHYGKKNGHHNNNSASSGPHSLPLERNMSTYDNVDHMSQIMNNKNGNLRAKDADLESVKSCGSSTGSEMSQGAMQYIREQMASSLNKIRDLEEQNKLIPQLQRELARLKGNNRDLEGQVQQLQQEKRTSRSPFSPQRVSPVQLQATAFNEMMQTKSPPAVLKAKLTREVGVQHSALTDMKTTATEAITHDVRSVGCQKESAKEECKKCPIYEEERRQLKKPPMTVPRGIQTEDRERKKTTREQGASARPEQKSVGCSDNSISDVLCEKCQVKRRSVGCNTDKQKDPVEVAKPTGDTPLSLKLLDNLRGAEERNMNLSMMTRSTESTTSVSKPQTTSIGIQMGNPMRDAGCQSVLLVVSNKSSQSDVVMVKGKATDTSGLVEVMDQGANTDAAKEVAVVVEPKKEVTSKSTNTQQVRLSESAVNTERVLNRDAAVECEMKAVEEKVVVVEKEKIVVVEKECQVCIDRINREVVEMQERQLIKEKNAVEHSGNGVKSGKVSVAGSVIGGGASKIPKPNSAMSPKTQRKPMAVLKRQETYTVEQPMKQVQVDEVFEERREVEEVVEPLMVKKHEYVCG